MDAASNDPHQTRTGTTATLARSETVNFPMIAHYQAFSPIQSDSAIDLDIDEMRAQLSVAGAPSFGNSALLTAMELYSRGGHSHPVAEVTLSSPGLSRPMVKGEKLTGINSASNHQVVLYAAESYPIGTTRLRLNYDTTNTTSLMRDNDADDMRVDTAIHVNWCQVGGKAAPFLDFCLVASGELVTETSETMQYQYDLLSDNLNDQTIQGLSLRAREEMYLCENCPYTDFKKFFDWYGAYDYADHFVQAAKDGVQTEFQNGNVDFGNIGVTGRQQAILSASVYLSLFMKIISQMERALDYCDGVSLWDSAVAFYTGSLEGIDGTGDGLLFYNLADQRCVEFKTCGFLGDDVATGRSYINFLVFEEFRQGQRRLRHGSCREPRKNKERIVQLMLVPLIQSTLRNAWLQSYGGDDSEESHAEGIALASAIVPYINPCENSGPEDAKIIYDNMISTERNAPPRFDQVKSALERNYQCLNITCAEVGGLWDSATGSYKEGAGRCSDQFALEEDNTKFTILIAVFGVLLAGSIVLIAYVFSERRVLSSATAKSRDQDRDFNPHVPEIA